jgi:hypothetical protein
MNRRLMAVYGILLILVLVTGGVVMWMASRHEPDTEGFLRPTRIPDDFSAEVRITFPPNGSILYSEAITIRGTSSAQSRFRVEVLADDDVVVAGVVSAQVGDWSIELPHAYTDDPTEVMIRAVPLSSEGEYDSVLAVLSPLSERPEGAFFRISSPVVGADVGGDVIAIEGRASGVPANALTFRLTNDRGLTIDERIVLLDNPYFVDDIPFTVEVSTGDYLGSALLTVIAGFPNDEQAHQEVVAITIIGAAG